MTQKHKKINCKGTAQGGKILRYAQNDRGVVQNDNIGAQNDGMGKEILRYAQNDKVGVRNDGMAESGRSMVEMLGVLAIIGVLSIGGITEYKYSMDRLHSNDLLNDVSKGAILLSQKAIRGEIIEGTELSADFGTSFGQYPFEVFGQDDDHPNTYEIDVSNVPKDVCLKTLEIPLPTAQTIYLNDDLTVYEDGEKVAEPACVEGNNKLAWVFNPVLSNKTKDGQGGEEEETDLCAGVDTGSCGECDPDTGTVTAKDSKCADYEVCGSDLSCECSESKCNSFCTASGGVFENSSSAQAYINANGIDYYRGAYPHGSCGGYTSPRGGGGAQYGNCYCSFGCFAAGTMITLANGTCKRVEDITYDDELLVWNFDEGRFDKARAIWLMAPQIIEQYNLIKFSDGSELKTIIDHRIFNREAGKFTYPKLTPNETPIGTHTLNAKGEWVTVESVEVVNEKVVYYNIITEKHLNCFAGNILTSCRLNNLYPIKDLKFVKDDRQMIPYEQFAELPRRWYDGLRLAEYVGDIQKAGDYDHGDKEVIDYVKRLMKIQQVG